jgi:hypothetical protein
MYTETLIKTSYGFLGLHQFYWKWVSTNNGYNDRTCLKSIDQQRLTIESVWKVQEEISQERNKRNTIKIGL